MGLESATYISGLNSSNPVTSDQKTEGDDHIRLLKSTLLATFPNVTGAVTPTHTELNYVDGVTSAIQTQLDAKAPTASPTFTTAANVGSGSLVYGNAQFNVRPNASAYAEITDSTRSVLIGADVTGGFIGTYSNHSFVVRTNNVARLTIDTSGNTTITGLIKGNNGGSGLGAITISTSAPSGGSSGDLWLKY